MTQAIKTSQDMQAEEQVTLCEFRFWYRDRYGEDPKEGCTHAVGRLDAWKEGRLMAEKRLHKDIAELLKWKQAVIDACTNVWVDVSGNEPNPREVIDRLVAQNIEFNNGLKTGRPAHEVVAYERSDDRTLKQLTTERPTTEAEHKVIRERRVESRRKIEDRRMEQELNRKFGE